MKSCITIYLLLAACCIASSIGRSASAVPKDLFLGISPQDELYYKSSGDLIKCRDGSKKFTRAQLNDDFCDCPDGSDEPGTSACPTGKFYCRNAGHMPLSLYSSRVNDGICDCCDGSDEYDGKVECSNTCWEAGKVARHKLKKKIATYQEGVTLRKQEVEQAKVAIAKDEEELSKLKNEEKILKGLVQQLKEHKAQIEKVEEEERLQREKEKAKKEADEKTSQDKHKAEEKAEVEEKPIEVTGDDKIGILEDPPMDQDMADDYVDSEAMIGHSDNPGHEGSPVDGLEKQAVEDREVSAVAHKTDLNAVGKTSSDQNVMQEKDEFDNNEALTREELGRLVASRWTGENAGQKTREVHDVENDDHENHDKTPKDAHDVEYDDHENHDETPKDAHDVEYDGYASDSDDQRYDDDDVEDQIDEHIEDDHDDSSSYKTDSDDESEISDKETSNDSSWLERIQQTVRSIIQVVNVFKSPVNISDGAHVRKEYDESSAKLSKIQSRISTLTQKLKHDFGPEKEFYSFYDRCFEGKQNKYVYKVCPYKQASQEEGHSTTRLGRWEKFEDSYRIMLFSDGDKCWNGPDRSLKVKLRCGLKNEVTDVDEPSRCEYVALLSTPALCREEKLKELEDKLDLMNKEQPQSHDEL